MTADNFENTLAGFARTLALGVTTFELDCAVTRDGVVVVSHDPELRHAMTRKARGCRTVPQIFIGETHVGGSDELHELDREGGLDPLLERA